MNVNEEDCMPIRTIEERRRDPAERNWADVRAGRPIPVHHVVVRHGDEGLKTCTPGELFSLLAGPCARVEWVALDPRPGPRVGGEAANVMPQENFVDYLSCSRTPFSLRPSDFDTTGGTPPGRESDR
jgi:hypothetical protein